mmetsp:Transcript_20354/g.38310  ORF Transcript_20354/g.38310 Transcript_20354/m.38310 type:complete len:324 (-) Transcript_20354:205-1176(-)
MPPKSRRIKVNRVAVRPLRQEATGHDLISVSRFAIRIAAGLTLSRVSKDFLFDGNVPPLVASSMPRRRREADKLVGFCAVLLSVCHIFCPLSEMRKVVVRVLPKRWRRLIRTHTHYCWMLLALAHVAASVFLLPDLLIWDHVGSKSRWLTVTFAVTAFPIVVEAKAISAAPMRHPTHSLPGLWALCAYVPYCFVRLSEILEPHSGATKLPPALMIDWSLMILTTSLLVLGVTCIGEILVVWTVVVGKNRYLYGVASFMLLYAYVWAAACLASSDESELLSSRNGSSGGGIALNLYDLYFSAGSFDSRCTGSNRHMYQTCYYSI